MSKPSSEGNLESLAASADVNSILMPEDEAIMSQENDVVKSSQTFIDSAAKDISIVNNEVEEYEDEEKKEEIFDAADESDGKHDDIASPSKKGSIRRLTRHQERLLKELGPNARDRVEQCECFICGETLENKRKLTAHIKDHQRQMDEEERTWIKSKPKQSTPVKPSPSLPSTAPPSSSATPSLISSFLPKPQGPPKSVDSEVELLTDADMERITKLTSEDSDDDDDDDTPCCVCGSPDSSDDNLIIFCEGPCGLAYHQDCYPLPQIPDDAWYCSDLCRNGMKGNMKDHVNSKRLRHNHRVQEYNKILANCASSYIRADVDDEDARAVYFWNAVDAFFQPKLMVKKRSLLNFNDIEKTLLTVPNLGNHYLQQWEEEDKVLFSSSISRAQRAASRKSLGNTSKASDSESEEIKGKAAKRLKRQLQFYGAPESQSELDAINDPDIDLQPPLRACCLALVSAGRGELHLNVNPSKVYQSETEPFDAQSFFFPDSALTSTIISSSSTALQPVATTLETDSSTIVAEPLAALSLGAPAEQPWPSISSLHQASPISSATLLSASDTHDITSKHIYSHVPLVASPSKSSKAVPLSTNAVSDPTTLSVSNPTNNVSPSSPTVVSHSSPSNPADLLPLLPVSIPTTPPAIKPSVSSPAFHPDKGGKAPRQHRIAAQDISPSSGSPRLTKGLKAPRGAYAAAAAAAALQDTEDMDIDSSDEVVSKPRTTEETEAANDLEQEFAPLPHVATLKREEDHSNEDTDFVISSVLEERCSTSGKAPRSAAVSQKAPRTAACLKAPRTKERSGELRDEDDTEMKEDESSDDEEIEQQPKHGLGKAPTSLHPHMHLSHGGKAPASKADDSKPTGKGKSSKSVPTSSSRVASERTAVSAASSLTTLSDDDVTYDAIQPPPNPFFALRSLAMQFPSLPIVPEGNSLPPLPIKDRMYQLPPALYHPLEHEIIPAEEDSAILQCNLTNFPDKKIDGHIAADFELVNVLDKLPALPTSFLPSFATLQSPLSPSCSSSCISTAATSASSSSFIDTAANIADSSAVLESDEITNELHLLQQELISQATRNNYTKYKLLQACESAHAFRSVEEIEMGERHQLSYLKAYELRFGRRKYRKKQPVLTEEEIAERKLKREEKEARRDRKNFRAIQRLMAEMIGRVEKGEHADRKAKRLTEQQAKRERGEARKKLSAAKRDEAVARKVGNCLERIVRKIENVMEPGQHKYRHKIKKVKGKAFDDEDEDDGKLYCICRKPYDDDRFMICCGKCVHITAEQGENINEYVCINCESKTDKRTTYFDAKKAAEWEDDFIPRIVIRRTLKPGKKNIYIYKVVNDYAVSESSSESESENEEAIQPRKVFVPARIILKSEGKQTIRLKRAPGRSRSKLLYEVVGFKLPEWRVSHIQRKTEYIRSSKVSFSSSSSASRTPVDQNRKRKHPSSLSHDRSESDCELEDQQTFQCEHCDKVCASIGGLKLHMKAYHPEEEDDEPEEEDGMQEQPMLTAADRKRKTAELNEDEAEEEVNDDDAKFSFIRDRPVPALHIAWRSLPIQLRPNISIILSRQKAGRHRYENYAVSRYIGYDRHHIWNEPLKSSVQPNLLTAATAFTHTRLNSSAIASSSPVTGVNRTPAPTAQRRSRPPNFPLSADSVGVSKYVKTHAHAATAVPAPGPQSMRPLRARRSTQNSLEPSGGSSNSASASPSPVSSFISLPTRSTRGKNAGSTPYPKSVATIPSLKLAEDEEELVKIFSAKHTDRPMRLIHRNSTPNSVNTTASSPSLTTSKSPAIAVLAPIAQTPRATRSHKPSPASTLASSTSKRPLRNGI